MYTQNRMSKSHFPERQEFGKAIPPEEKETKFKRREIFSESC